MNKEEVDLEKESTTHLTQVIDEEQQPRFWSRFHPDPRLPIKTTLAAIALVFVGIGLTLWGIVLAAEGQGFLHFVLGFVTLTPGTYACVQLFGAYRGWRGYAFENIPSYDT
ncbi:hypothetical protein THRCLA_21425 [Thraustotheca clavata]|uniref:Transmembrane protein 230 n=1 Tax=Thraustotheca clavata TaxID=74557 RepID=A0A1V9ZWM6_9STRA|nr:hypothetical protein THRCLA_21425 [Thraustotheca clavata]